MHRPVVKNAIRSITPPIIFEFAKRVLRPASSGEAHLSIFQQYSQTIQSDEYIVWLCQILGGFLTPGDGNIAAFDYAIEHMPKDGAILEIGSFLGMSTNVIAYLNIKHGRKNRFYSCDPWLFEETDNLVGGYFDASSQEFRNHIKRVFEMSLEVFSKNGKPYAVESLSDNFLAMWQSGATLKDVFGREVALGGPISFAYVDGAHTYEGARSDFLGIDRHLMSGGFILFDDTSDDTRFGCKKVAEEVLAKPAYELVFKTPNYFFRKK